MPVTHMVMERMEYISGLIVSFIILFIGLSADHKARSRKSSIPDIVEFSIIAVAVLLISVFIKLWQCAFYRKNKQNHRFRYAFYNIYGQAGTTFSQPRLSCLMRTVVLAFQRT